MDEAWPDWPSTRYEQKALREGRRPHYLTWRKRVG
jgi:tRNA (guanine-N7-)-methyltransferase